MAPRFVGNCKGAYLLAMLSGITGTKGTNGTSGGKGMKGVWVVDGGVEEVPCGVDEELGECGTVVWECKETLAGVGILL